MDRTELAAIIFAATYEKPSRRDSGNWYCSPKQAFKAADHFLKEAKRQAGKYGECIDGNHKWLFWGSTKPSWKCAECHITTEKNPFNNPEPPKPKPAAREFICAIAKRNDTFGNFTNGVIYDAELWDGGRSEGYEYIRVREVLE